ncbi:MAG: hypothetical protein WKG07_32115 [Hymenobacter sp.]
MNPARTGTKAAAHYHHYLAARRNRQVRLRLGPAGLARARLPILSKSLPSASTRPTSFTLSCNKIYPSADARAGAAPGLRRNAVEQAVLRLRHVRAGWPATRPYPAPPERLTGRNADLATACTNYDIISMPDTWEYPWYAAWDLAFHCLPLAHARPGIRQEPAPAAVPRLVHAPQRPAARLRVALSRREPAGARLGHAGGCIKIDQQGARRCRRRSVSGNRVPPAAAQLHLVGEPQGRATGSNIFEGGFLGLDNIGVFDRSAPLPTGGTLEQADGTAWMAMFALNMMRIALELAQTNPVYQDLAMQVLRAFPLHRRGHDQRAATPRSTSGTMRTSFTTTC